MPDTISLIDPKSGQVYEAPDEETAQRQMFAYGLDKAAPDQVQAYDEQQRSTGLVDKAKAFGAVAAGQGAELLEYAGSVIPQVDAQGNPVYKPVRAENIAPFAYTPEMKERVRANPGTAAAATVATDLATAALIPGFGVPGAIASAASSGLLTAAGNAYINDEEYSLKDAAWAAGGALALEGVGAAAIYGGMRAKGWVANHLDAAVDRARRAAAATAEAETDATRAAELLRRNSDELYTKHQTTLDEALGEIDARTANAPERMFTPGALRKTVSENAGAQEEAFFDLAVKFDQAAQVAEVPGFAEVSKTFEDALGKNGAGMFDAMRQARKQLDALGAVESPLVRQASEALDNALRHEPTWGRAAKNYADVADDVANVGETATVNVREANARDALDQRLDRARRMAALTNDQKLKTAIRKAETAIDGADKVTGARILGETSPADIAKLQKKIDGFAARAPKLGRELQETFTRLNKTLDGAIGEMSEDAALDYVAARASGIGGKADPLRETLGKAEKEIAAMKARGADPRQIAKATSDLRDLREAVAEVHEIPRAQQRIRDWEARPTAGTGGIAGKIAGKVTGFADDLAVDEIQNALQPMLHAGGFTVGLHVGGLPGAAVGYLGGRALNKTFGERISRWVWNRSKKGVVEFAKKNPLEAAGAAIGAAGGSYMGPKGVISGAIAGRNAAKRVGDAAKRVSEGVSEGFGGFTRRIWKDAQESARVAAEGRAARSVGAAAADPSRGPIGEYVRDAAIKAGDALEDLEKAARTGAEATAETATKAWEATKEAGRAAAGKVSETDIAGAAASAAQKARHVAGDAVASAVDAAQKAGAKAPEIIAGARKVASSAVTAAQDVAKAATSAARRAGAKAADVATAASEAAASAASKVGSVKGAVKGAWDATEHAARAAFDTAREVAKAAQRATLKSAATARTVASATALGARRAAKAANDVVRSVGRAMKGVGQAAGEGVEQAVAKVRSELEQLQKAHAAQKEVAARTFKPEVVKDLPNYSANAARAKAAMDPLDRRVLERAITAKKPNAPTPLDALNARLNRSPVVIGKPRWLDPGTKQVYESLSNAVRSARASGNVVHGEFFAHSVMSPNMVARLKVDSDLWALNLAAGMPPPTLRTKQFMKGTADFKDAWQAARDVSEQLRGSRGAMPVLFRINSRGAVPLSEVEALLTTPGARMLVKKVVNPPVEKAATEFTVIHLEDISLSAQRRMAKEAPRDFAAENIRKAKNATVAVNEAEKVPLSGRLLEAAKNNAGHVAGAAALAGSAALSADDQQGAAAAAASAGLLSFFLPKGGLKFLAREAETALEHLPARARLQLRQATEAVAAENEAMLRHFAAKKGAWTDAKDLLDAQFANYQREFMAQNKVEEIPEHVLDALEAELRTRNAAIIEADPELHRLAEVGRFDLVKGEGKGVQGVPELRKFGLPEPGNVSIAEGQNRPVDIVGRHDTSPEGRRQAEYMAQLRQGRAADFPEITPAMAHRNRLDRYNLAAEALAKDDLPQGAAQMLIDRRENMIEDMPRGMSEGQMFGYVDDRFMRWKAAAEKRIGRPLNERELELGEADFFYHATPRHAELGRLDEAIAKDDARLADYKKDLGETEPNPNEADDGPQLMQRVSKEARKSWQNTIKETRAEMIEEGAIAEESIDPVDIDSVVDRIREKHVVDPNDEIYIRKQLGQEPATDVDGEDIDDLIDDAVQTTAGYHDYGTDTPELTADDVIRQIENGETRAGNVSLTPWQEYHIRERFDENAIEHQERFDNLVEHYHAESEAEYEYENARDAERRGLQRDKNEDGERYDAERDGLPHEWALKSVGLDNVKVYDNAGVRNVFGDGPLTMRDIRGMFALDELRQFAKQEGSELKTSLEVDTDRIHFDGQAGGGSFHVSGEISIPHNGRKGVPVARYNILRVPQGSGFTKEGVGQRIYDALERMNVLDIAGVLGGAAVIGAGAKALHERAQEARDEVKAARMQMGREEDAVAALDRIDRVEQTRQKLGYLRTESEYVTRDAARALANPNPRQRVVATVPGVTSSQGVAGFLGNNSTLREAYDSKRDALQKLQQNPMLLVQELTEGLSEVQDHAPGLHAKMVQQTYKVVQFLQSKLPSTIGASLVRPEGSPPNPLALRQFALYYSAATDPASVMGDISNNRVRKEQIDTLKELWPDVYNDLKVKIVDQLSQGRPTVAQRNRLDLLFDLGEGLDRGLSNRLVASLNQYRQQKAQSGESPGPGGATMPSRRSQGSIGGTGALSSLYLGPAAGPGTLA